MSFNQEQHDSDHRRQAYLGCRFCYPNGSGGSPPKCIAPMYLCDFTLDCEVCNRIRAREAADAIEARKQLEQAVSSGTHKCVVPPSAPPCAPCGTCGQASPAKPTVTLDFAQEDRNSRSHYAFSAVSPDRRVVHFHGQPTKGLKAFRASVSLAIEYTRQGWLANFLSLDGRELETAYNEIGKALGKAPTAPPIPY
jgi:hypothetical protein